MTNKSLFKANKYYIVTFPTTHSALHAEKVLEETDMSFLVVPTPREISAGCGLSIRFFEESLINVMELFNSSGIVFSKLFSVASGQFKTITPNTNLKDR